MPWYLVSPTLWLGFAGALLWSPVALYVALPALAIVFLSRLVGGTLRLLGLLCLLLAAFSWLIQVETRPEEVTKLAANYETVEAEFEVIGPTRVVKSAFDSRVRQPALLRIVDAASRAALVQLNADRSTELRQGGRYLARVRLSPAFGGPRWQAQATLLEAPSTLSPPAPDPVAGLKAAFDAIRAGVTEDASALVAGLGVGDDSALSKGLTEAMRTVSLTHLTAVSGANCAIVVAAIWLLLRAFGAGTWLRFWSACAALLGYLAVVGPQPSVLRASTMAIVVLVAHALGRGTRPLAALALAISALLVADPFLAVDLGFALSVGATWGLLVLSPVLAERLGRFLPRWLALAISVSLAAQLACLPLLLGLQGGVPLYGVLANLLAAPLVAPITILGLLALLLALPVPVVAGALYWCASLAAWLIAQIAFELSRWPAAILPWPEGPLGLLLAIALVFAISTLLLSRGVLRMIGFIVVAALLAAFTLATAMWQTRQASWPPQQWTYIQCDVGQGDASLFRSGESTVLIDVGPRDGGVRDCLKRANVSQLDHLVLTHFDADHIGDLSSVLKEVVVAKVHISHYRDDRPAALVVLEHLERLGIPLSRLATGSKIVTQGLEILVLAPSRSATEASDGNDASLATLTLLDTLAIINLGDLGATGQARLRSTLGPIRAALADRTWLLKVAHHGSSDQDPQLHKLIAPRISAVSVGADNSYGHPTESSLGLLGGSQVLRTDELGSIALVTSENGIKIVGSG